MQTSLVGEQMIWTVVDFSYGFKLPVLGETDNRFDLAMSVCGNINLVETRRITVKKKLHLSYSGIKRATRNNAKSLKTVSHSLVGYFMLPLVFHLERQFVLLEHSHCSKVQQAICNRKRLTGRTGENLTPLKTEFIVKKKKKRWRSKTKANCE